MSDLSKHGTVYSGEDALTRAALYVVRRSWSRWQRFLWRLVFSTPFQVRVIKNRNGRGMYLLRATLLPRLAAWLPPVYLHYGFAPDTEDEQHNHPWPAVSLILSGGYVEERGKFRTRIRRKPGRVVLIGRETYHRILSAGWFSLFVPFARRPGPEDESWGFWNPETDDWWNWVEYGRLKGGKL